MSKDSLSSASAAMWIMTILVAPLLYVLSIGPVAYLEARKSLTISQGSRLDQFYGPIGTVMQCAPFNKPLLSYTNWWTRLGEKK